MRNMLPLPQLLAELVRRPSVNPMGRTDIPADILYESRVTDFLEARLRDLGVAVRRQTVRPGRDNLVATYTPPHPAPFSVMFEAHQDTVPVDEMIVEPFGAKVEGGKLYGRGSCDVKAGGAVMLAAFARLVKEKPAGSAAVTLAYTVDEEHTFLGIQELMKSGVRADYAIVAEPTLLNIVNAHKGVVRWVLETQGRACHSSRPENGVNAIYRMARLVSAVEEYAAQVRALPADPVLGPRTISVGRITGGVSANTVPDVCRVDVDRRLIPGETAESGAAHLSEFLKGRGFDFPFTLTQLHAACPPLDPALSGELVSRLGATINSVVGKHTVHPVPFGTDASTVANAGVPVVVFGPGDIAQAHTKDEWIDLSQLEPAVPGNASLLLAEYQINHPAPADVNLLRIAAVRQDVGAVTPGILQRIGEDRHAVERPLVVDALRQRENRGRAPRRIERHGAERVPEDVAEKFGVAFAMDLIVPTLHEEARHGFF
ncbi:acetylornithine deacetylase : Acetylornithine deacetylase or succinyl-diaminopimelate desuccinylase OS=Singulisphaera acidiphila (strain ATCC BAA-1392 / DSM 18658 / VKM B-2454 / MOB10) GN=Sinac_6205 PE=4 SV=1: Peptidase_M20: M20_dimer [Gemmataceae bacterium]|nr:acetylornithine deacetylase : Acetylornithine deacetylase or succinyl-diaminopimelate desuccinylase OS=Singulisphaera acidiphila (strain ATCC BAA-1392 / DSM 18658 / VKM B-2454 / MOB10) GN=Sinac_6205 PE=4 SV=1: Peptidase_M20: M20_dimer [Gemmataceae bacterium]VTT99314.1 acetylornithine deacetylase : Acetylornithine deacetylase or succinyl-diaminopimelate desuccinylase OS=Singulisphaera acidiphila (strain ATCC BAA-1392 / DSM 18658 / VKM B-2454 / MOB10) GN=Sinac_6205 PE=4 SV=1: Peptidase_M20: M20_d